jgi:hypothetical protein
MADRSHATPDEHPMNVTPAEARQATGPRDMLGVLTISLLLATVAGTAILAYFLA